MGLWKREESHEVFHPVIESLHKAEALDSSDEKELERIVLLLEKLDDLIKEKKFHPDERFRGKMDGFAHAIEHDALSMKQHIENLENLIHFIVKGKPIT